MVAILQFPYEPAALESAGDQSVGEPESVVKAIEGEAK